MAKDLGLGVFTPESTGLAKVNGIVRKTIAAKMETERWRRRCGCFMSR